MATTSVLETKSLIEDEEGYDGYFKLFQAYSSLVSEYNDPVGESDLMVCIFLPQFPFSFDKLI